MSTTLHPTTVKKRQDFYDRCVRTNLRLFGRFSRGLYPRSQSRGPFPIDGSTVKYDRSFWNRAHYLPQRRQARALVLENPSFPGESRRVSNPLGTYGIQAEMVGMVHPPSSLVSDFWLGIRACGIRLRLAIVGSQKLRMVRPGGLLVTVRSAALQAQGHAHHGHHFVKMQCSYMRLWLRCGG
jgi:hypothetical protein